MNVSDSTIFALDIGTRSVVGLILEHDQNGYKVIDLISKEHKERAMLDGQIHDVPSVANVIKEVKLELEKKHGALKKVCVAAAGRSLKTLKASFSQELHQPLLKKEEIYHLELNAVQQAQIKLATEHKQIEATNYYCVGYSVLHYRLDGEPISNLLEQNGKKVSVDIIATFLPKIVVDSLLSALTMADLDMEALTLEPIAAINVIAPASMRRLNIALVDIGAGTSDIAITDQETVAAYGMVPVAGDEITEALSDEFLLDFHEAEQIKRKLLTDDQITVCDVLGIETSYSRSDIVSSIRSAIQKLSDAIVTEILKLNKRPPKAVMLVGGGSLTPELPKHIAERLELPENRVVVRDLHALHHIQLSDEIKKGPELVTPIGIAVAAKEKPIEYISVTVNGRVIRLFDMKQLTVGDALLTAGINLAKLHGRPGMGIMVTINGRELTVKGELGKAPLLLKNGVESTLDAKLSPGDEIIVEKGPDGKNADVTIEDVIGTLPEKHVILNEKHVSIKATLYKNEKKATLKDRLSDRDTITFTLPKTIAELLSALGEKNISNGFEIRLNNERIRLGHTTIKKNGREATFETPVHDNDTISYSTCEKNGFHVRDLLQVKKVEATKTCNVFVNGESIELIKEITTIFRNGQKLALDDPIFPDDQLQRKENDVQPFIFQDIFQKIDVDLTNKAGMDLITERNGKPVSFAEPIHDGDQLVLKWVKREPLRSL